MVKALWTLVIFGIISTLYTSCNDEDNSNSGSHDEFYFKTVFRSQGPFATVCGGDSLIREYTQVRVFWDENKNGPDSTDGPVIPTGDAGIPEAMFGAYVDFYVNEPEFVSPVFSCGGPGGMLPQFYLRMYAGENGSTQWTSPSVAIYPHDGLPDTVDLPFDEWTCAFVENGAPPCHVGYSYLEIHRDGNQDDDFCLETCEGQETILSFADFDSNRAHDFPILKVNGSCDDAPDALFSFNPALWRPESYGNFWTLFGFKGLSYGKVTLDWLDAVPCTTVDTMSVVRFDNSTRATWHTTFENRCAGFELWLNGVQGSPYNSSLVGTISANRAENGSDYELTFGPLIAGYGYNVTLVAVDDDSAKYPCLRQTSN